MKDGPLSDGGRSNRIDDLNGGAPLNDTDIKFEYVGGGYYRDSAVPKGKVAKTIHGDEIIRHFEAKLAAIEKEKNALAAFKEWVHAYLDSKGVPHHPPGPHGAEGCRIGDRMDYVFDKM